MTFTSKLKQLRVAAADSRWWPFYLQRQFMSARRRESVASFLAARRGARDGGAAAADEAVRTLRETGLFHLGRLLEPEACAGLASYFSRCLVDDPYRPERGRFLPDDDRRPPESHVAYHAAADVVRAPRLLQLANDPRVLQTVQEFLGCPPTISYLTAWWSYPTGRGAQQAEHFHRDVDDWRFLKLFVYMTDVGALNGPHVYVAGSSASPKLRQIERFSDAAVEAAFGRESLRVMTGRAGEGFLEDTFGIHKGQPLVEGRRLIFQAVYSMHELPYGPKSAVVSRTEVASVIGAAGIDPWINRCYVRP
jgi:hypothetical protein